MTDELSKLLKEKEELEQRIRMLTSGTVFHGKAKIDLVRYHGMQCGKWAVSYRYDYTAMVGPGGKHVRRQKWNTLYCGESRVEAVMAIPDIIADLNAIYEMERGDCDDETV